MYFVWNINGALWDSAQNIFPIHWEMCIYYRPTEGSNLKSSWISEVVIVLTHWGRVTHICVGNLAINGSENGLSPGRRQAITSINVGILLIGPLGTNFSEMIIEIHKFSFTKIHLKMSSRKWRPFRLGLNLLNRSPNPAFYVFARKETHRNLLELN